MNLLLGVVLLIPSLVLAVFGWRLMRLFKAVFAPGTVQLVAICLPTAITIRVALGTLNTSDQSCSVQKILFW
jgi:hypothetical protein